MNNLLNENWIEALPDKVADNLIKQNAEVIEVICKRLKNIGDLRPTEIHKLANSLAFAGADLKTIYKIIGKYTELNKKEINKIFDKAAHENDAFAEQYYSFRGLAPKSTANDEYLKNLVRAIKETTLEKYENLSDTYAFKFAGRKPLTLRRAYTQAVDKAIYQVLSGTVDYNTALRSTVRDLSDSGLRTIDFESGVSRRVDSAVRMNILDGVRELSQKMLLYNGESYGSDGVELSAHALSAPDHVNVQGRQFSNEEFSKMQNGEDCKDVNGNDYAGFDRPIGQWNCKHFEFPIVIGASEPAHSDSELEALKNNSLKKYSLTQEMRKRERNIRKLKDRRMAFSAAGNELDAKRTQRDLNAALKDYTKFCLDNGFEPKYGRTNVDGYKRISSVDNSVKNGIINTEGERIASIKTIDSPIEQRNTAKGNPNAILIYNRPLNNRQKRILDVLKDYDSTVIVNKSNVNMSDLAALTAITGDEFALFTKGKERLVIRGNAFSVNVDINRAKLLSELGYKWSGHTHPGLNDLNMQPSDGDYMILSCFRQDNSVIYNSKGNFRTFEKR